MIKKSLYIGLIILLFSAGWIIWQNNMTSEGNENKIVSDNQEIEEEASVEEINDNIEKVIQEDPKEEVIVEEKEVVVDEEEIIVIDSSNPQPKSQSQPQPESGPESESEPEPIKPVPTPEEIEAEIVKQYTLKFSALKIKYEKKINNLIVEAKTEYFALTEKERKTGKFKLGLKYLKLGKGLEDQCDDEFNELLVEMKAQLKNDNLSMTTAKEAEKRYKSEKSQRRKVLMEKALSSNRK